MGKAVFARQFAAGLLPYLKVKVAGPEGTFEELLSKARFKEAKLRDLPSTKPARASQVTGIGIKKKKGSIFNLTFLLSALAKTGSQSKVGQNGALRW